MVKSKKSGSKKVNRSRVKNNKKEVQKEKNKETAGKKEKANENAKIITKSARTTENLQHDIVHTLEGGEKLTKSQFLEYYEKKVRKVIRVHNLIGKKERILVAASGGKDSTVALYLIWKIMKESRKITVEALHVDQSIGGYSAENKKNIIDFCNSHGIKLHITSFREEFGMSLCFIRDALRGKGINWKSCTICGILRRYILNRYAKNLNATKIVIGHNLDDEAQTVIMNMFKNNVGLLARLGPKTGIEEFEGFVPRIKPLYLCSEDETVIFSKLMGFNVVYDECPCRVDAYRKSVCDMLDKFESDYPGTKHGIVKSYLEMSPVLKDAYRKVGTVNICKSCGEPSAGDICNTCKLMGILRENKNSSENKSCKNK